MKDALWFLWLVVPFPACAADQAWVDKSPHQQVFAKVNETTLEYLDWGGRGEAVVFLAGMGSSAHLFDRIAPEFTNDFHVLGLTRRGFGKSGRPGTGYDLATLTEDIRLLLDQLKIERVVLAGHSFGGIEMTLFAQRFPERVIKLVFLDSAFDYRSAVETEVLDRLSALRGNASDSVTDSFFDFLRWNQTHKKGWNDACEADFRNTRWLTATGQPASGHLSTSDSVVRALAKSGMEYRPDYRKITAPVLAFYTDQQVGELTQRTDLTSGDKELIRSYQQWHREQVAEFRHQIKTSRIIELADSDHYTFIQREDVVQKMLAFLKSR